MSEDTVTKCQACGKKMSTVRTAQPDAPKVGYECSKCHEWVCSECTDWNASESAYKVCGRCSGRVGQRKCGCD